MRFFALQLFLYILLMAAAMSLPQLFYMEGKHALASLSAVILALYLWKSFRFLLKNKRLIDGK